MGFLLNRCGLGYGSVIKHFFSAPKNLGSPYTDKNEYLA